MAIALDIFAICGYNCNIDPGFSPGQNQFVPLPLSRPPISRKDCAMNLKDLTERKKASGMTNEQISAASGIPLSTVQKIFAGQTKSPRYHTIEAIASILPALPETDAPDHSDVSYRYDPSPAMVREDNLAYGIEATPAAVSAVVGRSFCRLYTLEDYYALPEGVRVELIDGRIYDLASPGIIHQRLVSLIGNRFFNFMESGDHGSDGCEVFFSPVDVRILRDDYNMLVPDLTVVCRHGEDDRRLEDPRRIEGAPDFVMEVLSPSSIGNDRGIKYLKYRNAGVREYWMVDPGIRTVTVCDFEHDTETVYNFEDRVPVRISGGKLIIDFIAVAKYAYR